ncbi:accessory regulator Y, partial [Staphylococcus epidermidis]|nr:accessory regulator Y [Staphylococcus epidermidis]
LKGIISLGPIIKTLQSKGYLIKSRSRDDERYIVLTLRKEKINVIQSEIEECYNKLEQGIQHV